MYVIKTYLPTGTWGTCNYSNVTFSTTVLLQNIPLITRIPEHKLFEPHYSTL